MIRRVLAVVTAALGLWGLSALVFRARMLNWGASEDEVQDRLPGDELLPQADLTATRAITIAAPPRDVWPWLVQIGNGRAGAYTYDWLEQLAGLDIHSSDRIVPELQTLEIGDVIPVENDGTGLRVHRLESRSVLATITDDGTWAWSWVLRPADTDGATRVISRTRMRTRRSLPSRLGTSLFVVPASWVMERRMLVGLRDRAEGRIGTGQP